MQSRKESSPQINARFGKREIIQLVAGRKVFALAVISRRPSGREASGRRNSRSRLMPGTYMAAKKKAARNGRKNKARTGGQSRTGRPVRSLPG